MFNQVEKRLLVVSLTAIRRTILFAGLFTVACAATAVPVLQVGAPTTNPNQGTYADYVGTESDPASNPTEKETAFTSGNKVYVAGLYQTSNVVSLGGMTSGSDWSGVNSTFGDFDDHGAILVAAIPDGSLANAKDGGLTINGEQQVYYSATLSGLFPNNHDPLKDSVSDFLFFDIGNFGKKYLIPDFADESTGSKLGEILELTLGGTFFDSLAWIHFDVMALETTEKTTGQGTKITSTMENNPGSHDVTWKKPVVTTTFVLVNDPPTPNPTPSLAPNPAPEPNVVLLMAMGLLGLGAVKRCRRL